ncbi:MAG: IS4 family transposase [Anaerolineales bacterium]
MIQPTSLFAQILSLVKKTNFQQIVEEHKAEYGAKGFSSWAQFASMLFGQFAKCESFRELCHGLHTLNGKLIHLAMEKAPSISTLAYANEHRPWEVYRDVFFCARTQCEDIARLQKRKFRFRNKVESMDATWIPVCLSVFDKAHYRHSKGAVKLYMLLSHQGYLPKWAAITTGKIHEVKILKTLVFEANTIVVIDRGYTEYKLFAEWTRQKVYFVTRMKDNATYRITERREVPEGGNVRCDQTIRYTGYLSQEKCDVPLRRISYWDPETRKRLVFLTNIFNLAASTIALTYKDRWQIETFFRVLKQLLPVQTFLGIRENAVQTQIWIALTAILLLKFLQMKSRFQWHLSNLPVMIRLNLLQYFNLWLWLSKPFGEPMIRRKDLYARPLFVGCLGQQKGAFPGIPKVTSKKWLVFMIILRIISTVQICFRQQCI